MISVLPLSPPCLSPAGQTECDGVRAAGGVGLSAKNELLLLHTSLDMRTSTSSGLTVLLPEFVESLKKWRITARAVAAASVHSTPRQPTPS